LIFNVFINPNRKNYFIINYFNFKGKKVKWNKESFGPVGRLSTEGLQEVFKQFSEELGIGSNADYLRNLFTKSYLEHANLADATRFLANELFKNEGLVIIDGDSIELKKLFIPYVKKELLEQNSFKNVMETNEQLKDYFVQVNPREINLFYIEDNLRERIIFEDNKFKINNTNIAYTNSISNITYDIANDGVVDAYVSGATIPNNNITINSTGLNAINTYMAGTCLNKSLPIVATSQTAGTMSLSNLVLNYSINPISLNISAMKNYMNTQYQTNSGLCYQETANVSTSCGGLATGKYAWSINWTNVSKLFDEVWAGGGSFVNNSFDAYFYINYSKPNGALNTSLWQIRADADTPLRNVTITNDCWNPSNNNSVLQFRMMSEDIGLYPDNVEYCFNGTSWNILTSDGIYDGYEIYEEAMWWNISKIDTIPIKYAADNWGIINTYSLSISALTDNNYTFTGWAASATSNMTKTLKLIWSNYTRAFSGNPYGLKNVLILNANSTDFPTLSGVTISSGALITTSTGNATSRTLTLPSTITSTYFKIIGEDIPNVALSVSFDGISWETVANEALYTPVASGSTFKIKPALNSTAAKVYSIGVFAS